jgi:hypothetical protein
MIRASERRLGIIYGRRIDWIRITSGPFAFIARRCNVRVAQRRLVEVSEPQTVRIGRTPYSADPDLEVIVSNMSRHRQPAEVPEVCPKHKNETD